MLNLVICSSIKTVKYYHWL